MQAYGMHVYSNDLLLYDMSIMITLLSVEKHNYIVAILTRYIYRTWYMHSFLEPGRH